MKFVSIKATKRQGDRSQADESWIQATKTLINLEQRRIGAQSAEFLMEQKVQ
jgi:hypothetical protein